MNKSLDKRVIYVTGLPRAGSTLLCQLLGHHADVYSPGYSSPLPHTLDGMRRAWSNDFFLLAQLDVNFKLAYGRLHRAMQGFVNGWFDETDRPWVVDKNRAWLGMAETVAEFDSDFRMLVCVRELSQLYGSIEAQHLKTQLLDSGENTAGMTRFGRASHFFNGEGMVARALTAIQSAIEDFPPDVKKHLLYVKFDRLVDAPRTVMNEINQWLGLPESEIDPDHLKMKPSENDSYYRYKFLHRTYETVRPPTPHWVPERIRQGLRKQYDWYYQVFYPDAMP